MGHERVPTVAVVPEVEPGGCPRRELCRPSVDPDRPVAGAGEEACEGEAPAGSTDPTPKAAVPQTAAVARTRFQVMAVSLVEGASCLEVTIRGADEDSVILP
jgi:uncharacterized membrane protein